ncbi:MAG: phosphoglucosamine mutase [Thermaerobacter sp.]|nr:phosphoglucosamine mutase [Thermaerobacter sp.]
MRIFGTDGVRGKANTELTPELALRLGRATIAVLNDSSSRAVVYMARDTRISGDMLASAFAAGVLSAGADVVDLGVLPTPALAYITRLGQAAAGVMISASHNPAIDNGIKLFTRDGYKLPDAVEDEIERQVQAACGRERVAGDKVGRMFRGDTEQEAYVDYLLKIADLDLTGVKIVVDAAHGAAFDVAPRVLTMLGAEVVPLNISPDGVNINVECGSTYPAAMVQAVLAHGAQVGLAFDGDADRLIACDARGQLLDGDDLLHICGLLLKAEKSLTHNLVVATVMSNFGLDACLRREDIGITRSAVGDRYVLQEMKQVGAVLGGEQSGHCIFLNHSTTGDGLLTAVMLLKATFGRGVSLEALADKLERFPQILLNVPVRDKKASMEHGAVKEAIVRAENMVGTEGRVLVRPSGTEPLVRVMVEARTKELASQAASVVVDVLSSVSA